MNNVDFEEAWDKRIVADMDGITIPFIDLKNLLLSKFVSGRAKDKVDIEELQKVMRQKRKE